MNTLKQITFASFGLILLLNSCVSTGQITKKDKRTLTDIIEGSPVFSQHFTGFMLFDPKKEEVLVEQNAAKYFNPASNTKIITLYTALHILGDSLPVLHYIEKDSSLVFWGTGNPLFLHPDFPVDNTVFDFLKKTKKQLGYYNGNFEDHTYGEGWMWDDYSYSFQPEKSAFPIYGNLVRIEMDTHMIQPMIYPAYFEEVFTEVEKNESKRLKINRAERYNTFEYSLPTETVKTKITKERPFVITTDIIRGLLQDTLGKLPKEWLDLEIDSMDYKTLSRPLADSLYRRLMHESDNHIAEQLLLLCSDKIYGIQNTAQIIDYAKDSVFVGLPDELLWADGSGISRYNLFTPRSFVEILNRLYNELPEKRLLDIFPTGGKGTMKDWYHPIDKPYVFAKTGTLRNNHNLSGYIKTKNGRMLIFSFMHNNFKGSSKKVKKEMERMFQWIYMNY